MCNKLTNKEHCYFLVAVKTNNVELCKNPKIGKLKYMCLAALKNPKWCDKYIEEWRDPSTGYRHQCYYNVALARKEVNLSESGWACISPSCYISIAYEIAYGEPLKR